MAMTRAMKLMLLMVLLVAALGGCATSNQPAQSSPTVTPSRSFATGSAANLSASQAADQLVTKLTSTVPDAYSRAYAGIAIASTGLEISLAGPTASAVRAAIPATVDGVPVKVRLVAHSYADLQPVIDQIGSDRPAWVAQGIVPSGWGPDYASNKVIVDLENYTAAAASAIENKYGKDLVTVSKISVTHSAS
jgi:hypothetical protein